MTLQTWLAFCATETVLCFIPGPAVLFVVSAALARGAGAGIAAALGILIANAFYFALSGTGIAAAILASSELFTALRWIGTGYLLWLGLRMLLSRAKPPSASASTAASRSLLRGIIVQGSNPKALLFFVALLPQFINPAAAVGWQIVALGVSSVVIEFFVLLLYITLAVRARRMAGTRLAGPLERVGGGLLLAAGARLAFVRSN